MIVIIYCWHCRDYNKHQSDEPDYEWKDPYFISFSDAHNHILENPNATMDIMIKDNSNDN